MGAFADQATDHAFQRAMRHFHHHALAESAGRVVLEIAFDKAADAVDFMLGNRRRLALEGHDVHNARAFQDGKRLGGIEPGKAIAGKQRPVDLFLRSFQRLHG